MKNWKNASKSKWFGFVGVGAMVVAPVAAAVSCSSSVTEPKKAQDQSGVTTNINKNGNKLTTNQTQSLQRTYSYTVRSIDDGSVIETKHFLDLDKAIRFAKDKEQEKIAPTINYKFNGVTYDNIDSLNKEFDEKVDSIMVRDLLQSGAVTLRVAPSSIGFQSLAYNPHSYSDNHQMFIYNDRVYGSYYWAVQAWSLNHPNQKHAPELQTQLAFDKDALVVRISYDANTDAKLALAREKGVATADLNLVLSPYPPVYAWTIQNPYNPGSYVSFESKAELLKAISEWIKGDGGDSSKDPFTKINGFKYENQFYVDLNTAKGAAYDKAVYLIQNSEIEVDVDKLDLTDFDY